MFFKTLAVSLPLLGGFASASPSRYSSTYGAKSARNNQPQFKPSDQKVSPARGPSFIFNKVSAAHVDLEIEQVAAYSLQESYDASNWFSKFSVQNVRGPSCGDASRRLPFNNRLPILLVCS